MPDEVRDSLRAAAQPTGRDEVEASAIILDLLSDNISCTEHDFVSEMCRRRGVPAAGVGTLVISASTDGYPLVSFDEPQLVAERARVATRRALVRHVAESRVVQAAGDIYGDSVSGQITVRLEQGGYTETGTENLSSGLPTLGGEPASSRWMLLDRPDSPRVSLSRVQLTDGLGDLLGPRGYEVLREGLACFRQGRFIAAADLLAASSEAAWFTLARLIPEVEDAALRRMAMAGTDAASVINRSSNVMQRLKVLSPQTVNDVRAQAAHLRDLRNYGMHPTGDRDMDREDAFSEVGCAVLYMSARRYFTLLEEARTALGARAGSSALDERGSANDSGEREHTSPPALL